MVEKELISQAIEASKKAYAPYSKFHVGASLLTKSGKIIQGCNVENASYGLCNCAERTALFTAYTQGERDIEKLVVYVDRAPFTAPCGACRQVIVELAPNAEILLVNNKNEIKRLTVEQIMPYSFNSADLLN
jgi:cytidine deaminase